MTYSRVYYDNLDQPIRAEEYQEQDPAADVLLARQETFIDDRGQVFQTARYAVDPSDGSVGAALVSHIWHDAARQEIKTQAAGSQAFFKTVYDGLGREIKKYTGHDPAETASSSSTSSSSSSSGSTGDLGQFPSPGTYADATTVAGDTIMLQEETTYDGGIYVTFLQIRKRFHDATGTGELSTPSGDQPKARVSYVAQWYDEIGRPIASANYGTNDGTAPTRPASPPDSSDTVLVTTTKYNDRGEPYKTINPAARVAKIELDDRGRKIKQIANYVPQSSSSSTSAGDCDASDDTNVTIETARNADGQVSSITAVNSSTGNQTTQYVYGTTLADSEIATSRLKRAEIYPDSADFDDRITLAYNRQAQVTEVTDQQGTVHAFQFDPLGRQIHDRVTTLGSGVDGAVRRISSTYEIRGMKEKLTSYDNATVGSGTVDNEVLFTYNDFGQVSKDYQEHGAAVNTSTSPKVQYGYAGGGDNTIRPTTLTYPDGRVITSDYGPPGETNDALSRVGAIIDDDSTHLADYSYLGQNSFVEVDYTEPDLRYTLIGTAGGNDPDTGDQYLGLDRFGRIKDSMWYDYGASADADRIKYGYDRSGNRTYREQTVDTNSNYDEFYQYDQIDRLKQSDRGTLAAQKDSISSLNFAQCWELDSTGNWQGFKEDSDGDTTWNLAQTRTSNPVNEITDITETTGPAWLTPVYNRAGNMTTIPQPSDPTTGYTATYDAWHRLVKFVDGANTVSEYRYDAAKRRIVKKTYTGGELDETRHFYYTDPSKWQVIEERVDASTDPDRQFVWGPRYVDDLVLRDRDTTDLKDGVLNERLYTLQDANWNVTSIAATDGTIQERYAYDPYGTPIFLTPTFTTRASSNYDCETLYAGYRYDRHTGAYHVRHRVYIPNVGWLQRDPLRFFLEDPNLYGYVQSRPTRFRDPKGLEAEAETLCDKTLAKVLAEGYPGITGKVEDMLEHAQKCNVNFYCSDYCMGFDGYTFPADNYVHVCLSNKMDDEKYIVSIIIHEMTHANAFIAASDNKLCQKEEPYPEDCPDPPLREPEKNCGICIKRERPAYQNQCRFLFRGDKHWQNWCIGHGLYGSCGHACASLTDPKKPKHKYKPPGSP